MQHDPRVRAFRLLRTAAALVALCAIAASAAQSLGTHLWMDELLTIELARASSLPKLWSGIAVGIDGNPPLYLTLAWLVVHVTPAASSDVMALRAMNVLITMAAVLVLYRVSLRGVSRLAAWTGSFLFVALNATLVVLAFDLRTYAIYFLMSALAVLLQQRLVEYGRARDAVWLALGYAALMLSHNFGIVYVVCIALAGLLSQWTVVRDHGWHRLRLMAVAVIPALVGFAAWLPAFIQQSATGRPYLWIDKPDLSQLLVIVFSLPASMWIAAFELCCLIAAAIATLRSRGIAGAMTFVSNADGQYARYVLLLALSITGFTLTAWVIALLLFPIFVPRYFVPQLMVSCALHVAFCELAIRWAVRRFQFSTGRATAWAAVILPLLFVVTLLRSPAPGREPCTDTGNAYFETAFVDGTLPVITESPHVYLPRVSYAAQPGAYRFPLDWDVVQNYPQRSRGNATEFHVMRHLKDWQQQATIMTTDDIVKTYPQFLVIAQSGQAWFDNLQRSRDVAASKLADVASINGATCTLWKVERVSAKP